MWMHVRGELLLKLSHNTLNIPNMHLHIIQIEGYMYVMIGSNNNMITSAVDI